MIHTHAHRHPHLKPVWLRVREQRHRESARECLAERERESEGAESRADFVALVVVGIFVQNCCCAALVLLCLLLLLF